MFGGPDVKLFASGQSVHPETFLTFSLLPFTQPWKTDIDTGK